MTKHDFWRLLNYIEPFDEQPSQASTVGILPCSNREGIYTNENHKEFDGDISKLMGCLA